MEKTVENPPKKLIDPRLSSSLIIVIIIVFLITSYSCNFGGDGHRSDQCSVKARLNRKVLSLNLQTDNHWWEMFVEANSRQTVLKTGKHTYRSLLSRMVGPAAGLQVPVLIFSIYCKLENCGDCEYGYHWDRSQGHGDRSPKMRSRQTLISMCPKCSRCFRFFGHICRADPSQDHSRALYASTTGLPKHWRRRPSRPRQSWLWTIENDYTATQSGSGDSSTACAEHNSRADTRGNSYVTEKLRMMTMKRSARYVHLCMQYCAVMP